MSALALGRAALILSRPMIQRNPEEAKFRLCLRCEKRFWSEHFGNRVCLKCVAINATVTQARTVLLGAADGGRVVRKKLGVS